MPKTEEQKQKAHAYYLANKHIWQKLRESRKGKTGSQSTKQRVKEESGSPVFAGRPNKVGKNAEFATMIPGWLDSVTGLASLTDYYSDEKGNLLDNCELSVMRKISQYPIPLKSVISITRDEKVFKQNNLFNRDAKPLNILGEWERGLKEAFYLHELTPNVLNADTCEGAFKFADGFNDTIDHASICNYSVLFRTVCIYAGRGINKEEKPMLEIFMEKHPELKDKFKHYGWQGIKKRLYPDPMYSSGAWTMEQLLLFKP